MFLFLLFTASLVFLFSCSPVLLFSFTTLLLFCFSHTLTIVLFVTHVISLLIPVHCTSVDQQPWSMIETHHVSLSTCPGLVPNPSYILSAEHSQGVMCGVRSCQLVVTAVVTCLVMFPDAFRCLKHIFFTLVSFARRSISRSSRAPRTLSTISRNLGRTKTRTCGERWMVELLEAILQSSSLLQIHPFFLLPPLLHASSLSCSILGSWPPTPPSAVRHCSPAISVSCSPSECVCLSDTLSLSLSMSMSMSLSLTLLSPLFSLCSL